MGGDKTVLGVNIEHGTRHPSVISCAVSVGCWNHAAAFSSLTRMVIAQLNLIKE